MKILFDSSQNDINLLSSNKSHPFRNFQVKFQKKYQTRDEMIYRQGVYERNIQMINRVNRENKEQNIGYQLEENQFADLTWEEFQERYLMKPIKNEWHHKKNNLKNIQDEPEEIDWLAQNRVSKVKNQGQCGSCYAFATIGAIESAVKIKKSSDRDLTILSEQEIVDCSQEYGNNGCGGGMPENVLEYILDNKISEESQYPYTGTDDICYAESIKDKFEIMKYQPIEENDDGEYALRQLLKINPVTVAIETQEDMMFYKSGIYRPRNRSCGQNLNHGVLMVAMYKNYFVIKNSWSEQWGEQGYIKMAKYQRGQNGERKLTCGIYNPFAVVPILK